MLPFNRTINNDSSYIKETILSNIYDFYRPAFVHCVDNNLNKISNPEVAWNKAKIRVLICRLLDLGSMNMSITVNVMTSLLKKEYGEDNIFVDEAFMPAKEDFSMFQRLNLPMWYGITSLKSLFEFDALLISTSVHEEKANLFFLLHHSGIPMWFTQRILPENDHVPLILMGGNASIFPSFFLGSSPDGKDHSLVDLINIGHGEGVLEHYPSIIESTKGRPKLDRLKAFLKFKSSILPGVYNPVYKDSWRISHFTETIDGKTVANPSNKPTMNLVTDDYDHKPVDRVVMRYGEPSSKVSCDSQISFGCSSGSCTFCVAGLTNGGWREKPLNVVHEELLNMKYSSSVDSCNLMSFNQVYSSCYLELMAHTQKYIESIEASSTRIDVLDARPDYLDFGKYFGVSRYTLAEEGLSDRLRNGFFNKNLKFSQWLECWKSVCANRLMEVKIYLINSGLEGQLIAYLDKDGNECDYDTPGATPVYDYQDFDEFIENIKEMIDIRDKMGAKTSIRCSFTNLQATYVTGLRFIPRYVVIESLLHSFPELAPRLKKYGFPKPPDRRFTYLIEKLKPYGVRFRFGSRSHLTDFTQISADLGSIMTPIVYNLVFEQDFLYGCGSFSSNHMKYVIDELDKLGIDVFDVLMKKQHDHVFPDEFIQVNDKKYLNRLAEAAENFKANMFSPCLTTPATMKIDSLNLSNSDNLKYKSKEQVIEEFRSSLLNH